MKKILWVSNNFAGSRVHTCLCRELANNGYPQEVFTYINKNKDLLEHEGLYRNQFKSNIVDFHYQFIINKWDHLLYYKKIYKVARECERVVNFNEIGVIHAPTLFSDGGVAYFLSRKYHIPYVVTVRSTDIHPFLSYGYHTWPYCKKILNGAKKIIFVSDSLKQTFCNKRFIASFLPQISEKFLVQPNGIDSFWHDNKKNTTHLSTEHNLLYVGVFIKRKRIINLIHAVLQLKNKYPDIVLSIVGGGGELRQKVEEFANNNPDIFHFYGKITEKKQLLELYRKNSVFAMPSVRETFGLTYIESLSQNCAIIYSKNDGIDNMLPETAGIAVNPDSIKSIASAIDNIFENRSKYTNEEIDFSLYDWKTIAKSYYDLFRSISKK